MKFLTDMPEPFVGTFEERCAKLVELIKENQTVFFGGAGVSTASGIPDFRSADGLYNKETNSEYKPEYMLSKSCFNHNPKIFYEFYKKSFDLRNFEPNECHKKLAEMEEKGLLLGIVTQNVDCLHQKAGSKNVVELHGTIAKNYCIRCNQEFDVNYIFDDKNAIVRCNKCKNHTSYVKPKIVLYEERLENESLKKANEYIFDEKTNLLIVGGTSLIVTPASTYVGDYNGRYLVIINRDETPYDKYADIIFREDINEVFKNLKF